MRRALATAFVTAAFAAAVVFVPLASAGSAPPAFPKLANFTHAEINVRIAKQPHTLILNLGRIVSVDATQIVLVESDASMWTVPISPASRITLNGRPAIALQLHRRLIVETMQIDGGAAVRVRAFRI
jgi:hypothetical protein